MIFLALRSTIPLGRKTDQNFGNAVRVSLDINASALADVDPLEKLRQRGVGKNAGL